MKKPKNTNWGGRRAGSGRPRLHGERSRLYTYLPKEVVQKLNGEAEEKRIKNYELASNIIEDYFSGKSD